MKHDFSNMSDKNFEALHNDIITDLNLPGTRYISALDSSGDRLKIRVSDHSSNDANNSGQRVISFVTSDLRNPENPRTNHEFVVDKEGYELDGQNTVKSVLKEYDVAAYYDKGEKKITQNIKGTGFNNDEPRNDKGEWTTK